MRYLWILLTLTLIATIVGQPCEALTELMRAGKNATGSMSADGTNTSHNASIPLPRIPVYKNNTMSSAWTFGVGGGATIMMVLALVLI